MPDTDLKPFSVTDGKISNQAKINPKKIAPANETSVLIAQSDRKYQPKTIYGDATLAADGKLTLSESATAATTTTTVVSEVVTETIPEGMVKVGSSFVPVSTKSASGTIPIRTGTGKLEADTLEGKALEFVVAVSNHTAGTTETLGVVGTGLAGSTNKTTVPKIVYEAVGDTSGSHYNYIIPHGFGYIPQVTVLHGVDDNCGGYNYSEIDAEVESGTQSTTVKTSEQGLVLKMILG
jgi:hypothetical protein